jgi:peptidoglycan/xylan/chitin deacetylase (PgdA/CDA1 family)
VQPELFERVYDRSVNRLLRAERAGDWWAVDVAANADRLVEPALVEEPLERRPTVCICHDIEAGLGHVGIDADREHFANRSWRTSLAAMLEREAAAGVRATYNVVGSLLQEIRAEIETDGHCIAFHSYDHQPPPRLRAAERLRSLLPGRPSPTLDQLAACRRVDYRLKGYRVPRSRLTPELSERNLLLHNFEWVASSVYSLGIREPELRNGVVWIPVHGDDFELYRSNEPFASWKSRTFDKLDGNPVAVVSLHDCYAELWLDDYDRLLTELAGLGELRTLDEVAAEAVLAASV